MKFFRNYSYLTVTIAFLIIGLLTYSPARRSLLGLAGGDSSTLTEGSEVSVLARLYVDGRPTSGERGTVRDFVGWNQCLYVSYVTLEGDQYLDIWSIADKSTPRFLAEHSFGNAFDDSANALPVAHLKAPRDLNVVDSHLILWTLFEGKTYPLQNDCSLGAAQTFVFSDGINNSQARLENAGNYFSSLRYENNQRGYQLLNFQNPENPFIYQGVRLQTPINGTYNGLPASLSLSQDKSEISLTSFMQNQENHVNDFWGDIITILFNESNLNLSVRQLISNTLSDEFVRDQQNRLLDAVLAGSSSNQRVLSSDKATIVIDRDKIKENKKKKNKEKKNNKKVKKEKKNKDKNSKKKKNKNKKGKKKKNKDKKDNSSGDDSGNSDSDNDDQAPGEDQDENPSDDQDDVAERARTVAQLIRATYDDAVTLSEILEELNIPETDSVELALEKVIQAYLPNNFDRTINRTVLGATMSSFNLGFYGSASLSIDSLQDELRSALDVKLEDLDIVDYTVDRIFSPFVENAPYMNVTAGDLLDDITDNVAADAIDVVLGTYRAAIPINQLLQLVGFSAPSCFQIPASSRNFLNIALVNSGPEINLSNPAFFEILRIANYYFGDNNFSRYQNELRERIKSYHLDIASEVVSQVTAFRDVLPDGSLSLDAVLSDFADDFSLKAVTARIIAKAVLADLQHDGFQIDATLPVGRFLADNNLELNPFGSLFRSNLATISDLVAFLELHEFSNVLIDDIINNAKSVSLEILKNELAIPLEKAADNLIGANNLDLTLNDVIQKLLIGRINPHITADFIEDIIGQIVSNVGGGIPLPGILGSIALASQGDCISQWRIAYDAAAGVAAGLQLSPLAATLEAASIALQDALELSASYVIRSMIDEFVSDIFDSSSSSYPTWYTALVRGDVTVNIEELSGRSGRIVDSFLARNRIVAVFREMGSIGVLPGENRTVTLLTFDAAAPQATKQVTSLGEWQSVTSVKISGDVLMVAGTLFLSNGRTAIAVRILDVNNPLNSQRTLYGNNALLFSATSSMKDVSNGELLGIISEAGGIALFQ